MTNSAPRYRSIPHRRGEDTRTRLIETAIEVFAALGFEGATTRMLADRADANLPAIQYYFGSKEGLYRAAVEHIVQQFNAGLMPIAQRIKSALEDKGTARKDLVALLDDLLSSFVALMLDEPHSQGRKLFFARAEIERASASDHLHDNMMRQLVKPCAALVGRLLDRPANDEMVMLRTLSILGQVSVFCNTGARRALGWTSVTEYRIATIQALAREHTHAMLRAAKDAKP